MPAVERVVVWRTGGTLLAVPLESTVEVAPVRGDGRSAGRSGSLPLVTPPGVAWSGDARRAVVVRAGNGVIALAAESVEGVLTVLPGRAEPTPPWLAGVATRHIARVVRLDGGRVAALLSIDSLASP